jgi:hypothetical protein
MIERACKTCGKIGCTEHGRRPPDTRPSRHARGYGNDHYKLRAKVAAHVRAGGVRCVRCREPILPSDSWDLGHDDTDRSRYTGPEHARCNRATKTHALERASA